MLFTKLRTKRKIVIWIFRFFFFVTPLAAQEGGNSSWFHGEAGTNYFNVLKQTTASSSSTIFSRDSHLRLSYSKENDSVDVTVISKRFYGNYSNSVSAWSALLQEDENSIQATWKSRMLFFDYKLGLNGLIQSSKIYPGYLLCLSASPFGKFFSLSGEYSSSYQQMNSSILFQDFFVSFEHRMLSKRFSFVVDFFAGENIHLGFSSFNENQQLSNEAFEYTAGYTNAIFGRSFECSFHPINSIEIFGNLAVTEERPTIVLNRDALSFGNFPEGEYSQYSLSGGTRFNVQDIPMTIAYNRSEYTLTGTGLIESWPFTSFAASVIANRLLFNLNSSVVLQDADVSAVIPSSFGMIKPELAYYHIQPEYTLKHWQPEFLVFGATAFGYESSSIKTIHAVKIGLDYSFPFFGGSMKFIAYQFLPAYIQYETHPSTQGNQPIESTADTKKNSVDGGRFLGINFIW